MNADALDALLPQTQCTQCGFAGCRPYAEALADGTAPINRCPPGGRAGIERLAAALDRPVLPLDPACGVEKPVEVALIDESLCIGCTLCIQACPVDAIIGAGKRMHTVILDECTGCELCVAPCPVDCISMHPVEALRTEGFTLEARPPHAWRTRADRARDRMHARTARLARERLEREARLAAKAEHKLATLTATDDETHRKRGIVEAAIARARARRQSEPAR